MDLEPTKAQTAAVNEVDLADLSLSDLEKMDDSVLVEALRQVKRSAGTSSAGTAAHNSTTHTSSHSSAPW